VMRTTAQDLWLGLSLLSVGQCAVQYGRVSQSESDIVFFIYEARRELPNSHTLRRLARILTTTAVMMMAERSIVTAMGWDSNIDRHLSSSRSGWRCGMTGWHQAVAGMSDTYR
jgi:hypothetical protein